jgi:hypothetical protein
VNAPAVAIWLRALRAVGARGLLPANRSELTPGELAAEVARHGEDRLVRLVHGWYYPTSYGRVRGALSDEEADRLVAALEAEVVPVQPAPPPPAAAQPPPPPPQMNCELCGFPVAAGRSKHGA